MAEWWEKYPVAASPPAGANWWDKYPAVDETNDKAAPVVQQAAVPAEEETWMDKVTGDARIGAGVLDQAGRGIAEGVLNIAGLPADLINIAPMAANLIPGVDGVGPITDEPYFGSTRLKRRLDMLNEGTANLFGVEAPVAEPENIGERFANRIGEEVGAASTVAGGIIAKAGRMGVDAARNSNRFARMFLEPAAVNPAKFAGKEMAVATAAGQGAALANEVYPDSAIADLIGAVGGAGAFGIGTHVGVRGLEIIQALTRNKSYADDVTREAAADAPAAGAGLKAPPGGEINTDELVAAIGGGPRIANTIPGYQESLADRTGNAGLAALEYSRQSRPDSVGVFAERRKQNTAAVDAAINRSAPVGQPGAFSSELATRRDIKLDEATQATQAAEADFERASRGLVDELTGEGRGANIRAALEDASTAARAIVSEAWKPLNESAQQIDVAPLAESFKTVDEGLSVAERRRFQPEEATIPAELAEGGVQPLREVTGLRSALTDAAREAATAGRSGEARIINQHIDALDKYLEEAVPVDLRSQYDAARAARRDVADRFERPQTAIAQTLARQEGQYRQPDSAVAGKFVQSDEGKIADFEALMREAGSDDRVQTAVRDQILADVRKRGLLHKPDALDDYLRQYGTVFNKFPALKTELGNAGAVRRQLATAEEAETSVLSQFGEKGKSAVAKYLQYEDANAERAMKGIMANKEPGKAIDELLTFVEDQPAAVEGARKVFWDILQKSSRSGGETTRTIAGDQPWLPNKLKGFLDDPAKQAVAERLWRDNPEHLENVRTIADALQHVDMRSRARAPNTSGTAQGVNPLLTPEALQSRWYAYLSGRISGTFLLTSIGAVTARRAVGRAREASVHRLIDEALDNPEVAAMLLKENNPANRAAMRRKAKTWFGNEASTILQMFEDEEDPTVRAAME